MPEIKIREITYHVPDDRDAVLLLLGDLAVAMTQCTEFVKRMRIENPEPGEPPVTKLTVDADEIRTAMVTAVAAKANTVVGKHPIGRHNAPFDAAPDAAETVKDRIGEIPATEGKRTRKRTQSTPIDIGKMKTAISMRLEGVPLTKIKDELGCGYSTVGHMLSATGRYKQLYDEAMAEMMEEGQKPQK